MMMLPGVLQSSVNKSTVGDKDSNIEIGVTSDGNTIPIVRADPLLGEAETHDQVLRDGLGKEALRKVPAPTIEQLSKMFYTTKHRWYPVGQYHNRRRKLNPPKDR
ncbi:hypothetical protein DNTS_025604 [Danionella cerebrum]|uniref:Large ribosomal subunit protein mL42 n=1 Tax=Danionella cerebrum TaxID=2873325 RepID=A0A553RHX7_9TELE|nr:hypothetical protein DNTS_025604 [Danionella translucida]